MSFGISPPERCVPGFSLCIFRALPDRFEADDDKGGRLSILPTDEFGLEALMLPADDTFADPLEEPPLCPLSGRWLGVEPGVELLMFRRRQESRRPCDCL